MTLDAPDGPVTVQARIDWTGSAPWRGRLGPEPLRLVVRPLDLIGGMVRTEDFLQVTEHDVTSSRPQIADRGSRLLIRWAVLTIVAALFLIGLFALVNEPTWLAILGLAWAVFLVVWIIDVVRVVRTPR